LIELKYEEFILFSTGIRSIRQAKFHKIEQIEANKIRNMHFNSVAFLVVGLLAMGGHLTQGYLAGPEALRLCRQRTGLKDGDIKQHFTRNQNCALDCETRQGTLMTAHMEDGSPCNDQPGYRCVMGMCRAEDNKVNDEFRSIELNSLSMSINSALVADRDPYPGQGESDAFVVVEVVSDGGPNYKNGEVVCHTHVVQDSSRPRWNFVCQPLALKSTARLRFVVMDSDKPDTQPQLLGQSSYPVESLLNAGIQTLILEAPKAVSGGPYWLEVELKGKRYTPGG